jgi:hypothetical protein
MARETIVRLIDDLDGTEATEELTFALRGVEYEIDLSAKNVAALEKALERYIGAGHRVGRRPASGRARRPGGTDEPKEDLAAIREWGKANGYRVSDRGRVSAEVKAAFYAAQT